MRPTVLLGLLMIGPCALLAWRAPVGAGQDAPPAARHVVVRGARDLDHALKAAFGGRAFPAEATAAVVLDVTPHTRQHGNRIAAALAALDAEDALPARWSIARLGERLSPAVPRPSALVPLLGALLGTDTDVPCTTAALARTLKSFPGRAGGGLVYLADWRFEDEHDLEGFVDALATRNVVFGVVGSEAAFGRAWNDGVLDLRDRLRGGFGAGGNEARYDERIGRRPFGPFDAKAPWHGGETAFPHVPYRFSDELWATTFDPSALHFGPGTDPRGMADLEDLLERLGRDEAVFAAASGRRAALPSGFGPHGLMRAAAVTGGRYVLWSWNPGRRAAVTYDFARVDHFGPHLASRSAIRKDATRRPLARALLATWRAVASKFDAVAAHEAPLDHAGRPASIDLLEPSATSLPTLWMTRDMHREFLRKAEHWRDAAVAGAERLERALAKAGATLDPVDRRYGADAALLRHVLQVLAFELAEAIAAAEAVPADAWQDDESYPGIRPVPWLLRGDDPTRIPRSGARPFDTAHGARIEAARREHLRRFGGTPFGVQVAANTVDTWVATTARRIDPGDLKPPGRTPGESEGTPPAPTPRPPGGGSSGGGPTTGGG